MGTTNIHILHGSEPYCIDYYKKKYFANIGSFNMDKYCGEFSQDILSACNTYPFLEEKKGVFLDIDTITGLDTPWFKTYCENPMPTTVLVVVVRSLDKNEQKKKLYKEWVAKGYVTVCDKITNMKTFRTILEQEALQDDAVFTEDGYQEFVKRMNYHMIEDLSLLQILQVLHTIAGIEKTLSKDIIQKYVEPLRDPNIYGLAQMLLFKNAEGLKKELALLRFEEPIKILSLLLKEYRIAYKSKCGYDKKEMDVYKITLSVMDKEEAMDGMTMLTELIAKLKNSSFPKEQALEYACMRLLAMRMNH